MQMCEFLNKTDFEFLKHVEGRLATADRAALISIAEELMTRLAAAAAHNEELLEVTHNDDLTN